MKENLPWQKGFLPYHYALCYSCLAVSRCLKEVLTMAKHQHLTREERSIIQSMLDHGSSLSSIARTLGKDRTTISKEIRSHLVFRKIGYKFVRFNSCANRFSCQKSHVCPGCIANKRYKLCRTCGVCNRFCPDFVEVICPRLLKKPYVCNSCPDRLFRCTLEKRFYSADEAHKEYSLTLSQARSGFSLSEAEFSAIDELVSPLIRQGQSPHHIFVNNRDSMLVSERSLYRLIDSCALSARNIDLPRKIRFKPRSNPVHFKVDKACRIGRSYQDFGAYMAEHPDTPVTQLDTVEGIRGGKVLLTIHFVKAELMLAFLRDHNDSRSVTDIFNHLYSVLGHDDFVRIFRLCLADNGSEFSNPTAIEFNENSARRSRLFYCDPSSPFQKGSAERNHEFIREFIPKGTDLAAYSQQQIRLMMDHINSYSRESLGDKTPYEMFAFLYGRKVLDLLECRLIPPQDVTLNRSIFHREVSS